MGTRDVTVIMPAHNEERFLGAAVASVEKQTYRPIELIIVDDGSTDRTTEIAREASGPVPVRVLRTAKPGGSVAARNWGLREAGTEWVAMLDADDTWMPNKLHRQMAFLDGWASESPLSVLGTKGRHINEAGADIGEYNPSGCDSEDEFRRTVSSGALAMIGHSSALFRRQDAIDVGGYSEEALGAEDLDLWDRIASLRDGVIVNLDEPLFCYRKKRGGMAESNLRSQQVNIERIIANRQRRRRGQPPLSLATFEFQMRQRPLRERAQWRVDLYGKWLYRFGATNVVNGRPAVGGIQLAAACALRPRLVLDGVRRRLQT